jgi:hypothetical protein
VTIEAATARGLYIDAMADWFTWARGQRFSDWVKRPSPARRQKRRCQPERCSDETALFVSIYEIPIFQDPIPPRFKWRFDHFAR